MYRPLVDDICIIFWGYKKAELVNVFDEKSDIFN